jgi:guanyl-specific ribonuclease Sa
MRLWKWTKKFRGAALWMLLVITLWITGCTDGSRGVVPQPVAPGVEKSVEAATEATTIYLETGSTAATTSVSEEVASEEAAATIDEDGTYTSKDDVASYISVYGKLPPNFITKKEAKKLGWPGGSLEEYAPGKCIGGDYFGNYEGLLPEKKGRKYYECDIDTLGKSKRGAKRIIYSNDGLIYYTGNHYESFELLYGEP